MSNRPHPRVTNVSKLRAACQAAGLVVNKVEDDRKEGTLLLSVKREDKRMFCEYYTGPDRYQNMALWLRRVHMK